MVNGDIKCGLLPYTRWSDKSNSGVRRGIRRFKRFTDFFKYRLSPGEVDVSFNGHIAEGVAVDVEFHFSPRRSK
jgi:hypothetical protein